MHAVKAALESKGYEITDAELASVPKNLVSVSGKTAESLVKLLEELEELDDVQKVAANCDVEMDEPG
jgi:transcriptional/translational regulatory protein YebC/TACO1